MSDLLTRLAEHSLDRTPGVLPRLASRFEERRTQVRPAESWLDPGESASREADDQVALGPRGKPMPVGPNLRVPPQSEPVANGNFTPSNVVPSPKHLSFSRSTDELIEPAPEAPIGSRAAELAVPAREPIGPPAAELSIPAREPIGPPAAELSIPARGPAANGPATRSRATPQGEKPPHPSAPSGPESGAITRPARPVLSPISPSVEPGAVEVPNPPRVGDSLELEDGASREAAERTQSNSLVLEAAPQHRPSSRPVSPEIPLKRHRAPILKRESAAEIMRSVREPASPEPTSVEVRIGRIEVRAVPKDSPRRAPAPTAKRVLGLDEYLERRPGEKGRR